MNNLAPYPVEENNVKQGVRWALRNKGLTLAIILFAIAVVLGVILKFTFDRLDEQALQIE